MQSLGRVKNTSESCPLSHCFTVPEVVCLVFNFCLNRKRVKVWDYFSIGAKIMAWFNEYLKTKTLWGTLVYNTETLIHSNTEEFHCSLLFVLFLPFPFLPNTSLAEDRKWYSSTAIMGMWSAEVVFYSSNVTGLQKHCIEFQKCACELCLDVNPRVLCLFFVNIALTGNFL